MMYPLCMRQKELFAQDVFQPEEVEEDLKPIFPLFWQGMMDPWRD